MKIGCAGILVSDTFCGPLPALPGEGQLLAVEALPTKAGGCAANVAIDLAKQTRLDYKAGLDYKISVEVAGCLGNDASARVLLSSLEAYGIGCERLVYSDRFPTSKTVILLVAGQDRRYIHSFGANAAFTVGDIDRDWVRGLDIFYLGGLFLMPAFLPGELQELLEYCRKNKVLTVVDVVIPQNIEIPADLRGLLAATDYFTPNEDEAFRLTGLTDPLDQLRALMEMGANTVFITCGQHGAVVGRDKQYWKAGIYSDLEVIDPSGCGDAFTAGVVAGVGRGLALPDLLRYASALGASAGRAVGTTDGVFTVGELDEFILRHTLPVEGGSL